MTFEQFKKIFLNNWIYQLVNFVLFYSILIILEYLCFFQYIYISFFICLNIYFLNKWIIKFS
jgi:hypothetical protein